MSRRFLEQPIFHDPDITDTTLVGAWLCPGVRGKGDDFSTKGNDLTAYDKPRFNEVGVTLNGSSQYFKKSIEGFRSSDSAGTIEAWVYKTSAVAWDYFFSSSDEGSAVRKLIFGTGTSGKIMIYVYDGSTANQIESTSAIPILQWNHVVLGSTGSRYFMFLNGDSLSFGITGGSDNGTWFSGVSNRDNVIIGAVEDSGGVASYWLDDIACVNIYSEAKTAGWVKSRWKQAIPEG